MKKSRAIQTAAFLLLTMILIVLIGSRSAEKTPWTSSPSGSGVNSGTLGGTGPVLDNDIGNIAESETTPTPVPTPAPTVYKPDVDISSWEFLLTTKENSIGAYAPNVVEVDGVAQYFDARAAEYLEAFLQGARDAGFSPYINTAYRPYSSQEYLFNGKASQISWDGTYTYEEAVELARDIVAYPGTSDHQTGLGVDITDRYYSYLDASQMDQELLTWLREHCAEYGFILRYPANKLSITGWDEPWHFRYVGATAAEYIMENSLCLEEFIKLYK